MDDIHERLLSILVNKILTIVYCFAGLNSTPSTPLRSDAPPNPFSPTPILPIGEVVTETSPVKSVTLPVVTKATSKRKITPVVKEEGARSARKKLKVEPIVPLAQLAKKEETPASEPAVVIESGPVEFAKEGNKIVF